MMTDQEKKDWLEDIKRGHQIAKELGMSNPATEAGELVQDEMRFAAWDNGVDDRIATTLADLIYKWKMEKNPYYCDMALMLCNAAGLMPSQTIIEEITKAAAYRLKVGHISLKSTAASIERENKKWQALLMMMNLIFYGETLERAASKTAAWMQDVLKVEPIKASSLDKYYVKDVRKSGIEKDYFTRWNSWENTENAEQWQQIINDLPEGNDTLKGNRR